MLSEEHSSEGGENHAQKFFSLKGRQVIFFDDFLVIQNNSTSFQIVKKCFASQNRLI